MNSLLHSPLAYIKGVGDQRADLLASELGIRNVADLLAHYPFRYVDRSEIKSIGLLTESVEAVQIKGILGMFREEGTGNAHRLMSTMQDPTGRIELIWFKGIKWVRQNFQPGTEYLAFGKVSAFKGHINIAHPELEKISPQFATEGYLQPVYSTTEKLSRRGMNSKGLEKVISELIGIEWKNIPESLPEKLREELRLIAKSEAAYLIHRPRSSADIKQATRRLKFEELFYIQLELLLKKELRRKQADGFVFEAVADAFLNFYENHLPFDLTGAQKRVLKEIRRDLRVGKQMNRLLQGDVGSGKTMVAALSALIAIDNGYQVSIMAPTEILANQHFETFSELFKDLPVRVGLLTGSTRTAKRRELDEACQSGELHILIGTHALIEDRVKFKNLGLAVIDEQHRFGVAQRAQLWKKNRLPPHILVMTATPIPRTLAMTLYGDLDVSVIDELPPGRKEVKTSHATDSSRLRIFGFIEDQIRRGRQVYVVYPLIEESSTLDLKDLMDGFESISRQFPMPKYQISILHGKMKPADKAWEMDRFVKGETQIMVATTVIEVGVNVPNASVMVIESAQRFGISQLHQLRGRVGRGADQSYCILVSDKKLSKEARLRLKTMTETNDGFKIAEVDLKVRGPGDLMGTQQSGLLDLKLADLATDSLILQFARNAVIDLLEEDPTLSLPENEPVANRAKELIRNKPNWSRIS